MKIFHCSEHDFFFSEYINVEKLMIQLKHKDAFHVEQISYLWFLCLWLLGFLCVCVCFCFVLLLFSSNNCMVQARSKTGTGVSNGNNLLHSAQVRKGLLFQGCNISKAIKLRSSADLQRR